MNYLLLWIFMSFTKKKCPRRNIILTKKNIYSRIDWIYCVHLSDMIWITRFLKLIITKISTIYCMQTLIANSYYCLITSSYFFTVFYPQIFQLLLLSGQNIGCINSYGTWSKQRLQYFVVIFNYILFNRYSLRKLILNYRKKIKWRKYMSVVTCQAVSIFFFLPSWSTLVHFSSHFPRKGKWTKNRCPDE